MRLIRRTALVLTTGALTLGVTAALPGTAAFADGTITGVTPASVPVGASRTVTFTTSDTYLSAPPPSVTITRSATRADSSPDSIDASSSSVSGNKVTATFDLTRANPGPYDMAITGATSSPPSPSTTDSCQACLTVTSPAPTATSVEPNPVTADFQYPGWTVHGTNFATGPYTQCTALPCSTTSPNVAIFNGAALDPDITLAPSSSASTGRDLKMAATIARTDVGGARTVVVTNSDGQSASCACMTIAPAMTVTSVTPNHLPAGSTGQTLTIAGSNFPSDVQVTFIRQSDGTTTSDVAWTATTSSPSQIVLSNVAISSNAPDGNEEVRLQSPMNHTAHTFPNVFAVGGTAPPATPTEAAPTDVTASGGDQQAFVQWTPPASASSDPITGYVVRTLPSGDPSTPAPGSASSATVGPLTNGQSYQFTVTVTYQSGKSYTSMPSNEATPSGKPDAPTNVQATAGDRNATVTWQPPAASNGTPVDGYTVTASPGGRQAKVFGQGSAAPATTAVVSGLTNGTTYTFTVTAHNGGGDSDPSTPSDGVTPIGDPVLTLHAPKAIDKGSSAKLRGQVVDSNGNPVAGASVKLSQRHSGAHEFGTVKVLKTGKAGHWSFAVKPKTTTRYRVHWHGDAADRPGATGRTVKVRETGRITSPKDGSHVSAGKVTVRGRASSPKGSPVALQERSHGKWETVATTKVRGHHRVKLVAKLASGTAVLRLKVSGALGTIRGYSPKVTLSVS